MGACVGRVLERAKLVELCGPGGPAVVFVHGAGGIGKSVIVSAVTADLGRRVINVDAHMVEPTPGSLLSVVAGQVDGNVSTLEELAAALAGEAVVLVLDSYERLGLVDDWVRNDLVPAQPASAVTIIVGRNAPNVAWRTSPGWRDITAELVVGPMTEPDAAALVGRREQRADVIAKVLKFGRGHPLALELAASAFARDPELEIGEGPPPEVVEELLDVLLADLDPVAREIVEAAAMLRRVTTPMLAAILDGDPTPAELDDAWRMLRSLPFVHVRRNGLEFNGVVHDVLSAGLELREPGRAREIRRRAGRAAMLEIGRAPGWDATADLLHLVQNPIVRYAFMPPPGLQHAIEAGRPADRGAILALAGAVDDRAHAVVLDRWWAAHPDAFRVLRGDDGEVRGFATVRPFDEINAPAVDDPVVTAIADDLRSRPLEAGQRALVVRRVLTSSSGELMSRDFGALVIDLKRTYLELRPALARVYVNAVDVAAVAGIVEPMGFVALPARVRLGEVELGQWALEFGPGSVDGWLARHVEIETDQPPAVPTARTALGSLSAREREVLAALAEGLTNRELADRLFISERTANRHVSNIFVKLGVRNRTAAARVALGAGLA